MRAHDLHASHRAAPAEAIWMEGSMTVRPYIVVLAALAAAACQTQGHDRTLIGAGGGALAGAAVGALTGDSDDGVDMRQRALIGAGIGALAGGAVGYYMDRQAAELSRNLEGTGVAVRQQDEAIYLRMPADVTFRTGSAAIEPQFYGPLNQVAGSLREYPQTYVDVVGHTDSTGDQAMNQRLSEERANAVAQYLIGQGVHPARILVVGMGEMQPIATNDTPQGRTANRRVEMVLTPVT